MNVQRLVALLGAGVVVFSAACGSEGTVAKEAKGGALIGPGGGVVNGPGASLTVPPGALDADTEITIEPGGAAPSGYTALSSMFHFTPDGLVFKKAATVEIDFQGSNPAVYWSTESGGYEALPTTIAGARARADVVHFSVGFVAAAGAPPPPPTEDGGSPTGSSASLAQAFCQKLFDCQTDDAKRNWADVAACAESLTQRIDAELAAPGTNFGAADLGACAGDLAAYTCGQALDNGVGSSPIAPLLVCKAKGALADGTACAFTAQCASGYCSSYNVSYNGQCGKCEPLVPKGGSCTGGKMCAWPLACANNGVCADVAQENAPCDDSRCSRSLSCEGGTCKKHLPLGATCARTEGTGEATCDSRMGHSCVSEAPEDPTGTCTLKSYAAVGSPCAPATTCAGSVCVNGTCTARIAIGAACTSSGESNMACESGSSCKDGKCGFLDPATCK